MGRKRKRDNHALSKRREDVSALYLSGMSQRKIAEVIGVNQATISRDITSLNAEWVEQARANLTGYKAVHLKRLEHLASEAWALYQDDDTGARTKAQLVGEIRAVYADITKLLGLETIKIEISHKSNADELRALLGIGPPDIDMGE